MNRQEILESIRTRFREDIVEIYDKSPKRVYIEIRPQSLVPVASYVFKDVAARFHIASGVDTRTHLEILYHFSVETINLLISLRVKLDKKNPGIDSLTPVFRGANWIEREIHEMLGIDFVGHPDLRRLLLADEWPQGVYPLRRDYKEWDGSAVRDRGV